jgi:hypothetical protein
MRGMDVLGRGCAGQSQAGATPATLALLQPGLQLGAEFGGELDSSVLDHLDDELDAEKVVVFLRERLHQHKRGDLGRGDARTM